MARTRSVPPAPTRAPEPRHVLVLLLAALALAVAAAHWPVLRAQAIALDDPSLIVRNPLVLSPSIESVRRFFTEVLRPSTLSAYYMPLSMTSLMLDAAAGGTATNQLPFHVTNLLLHVLGTGLLFLVLRRLTGHTWASVLAALLYGVHPLMVEAIASAGERKTVLATTLAFASTWAYVRSAQDGSRAARWGSVLLFALALLAKPSVLTLPVAFVVLDVWPLARSRRDTWLEKWPYALLAGVSAVLAVLSVKYSWEFASAPPLEVMPVALKCAWLPAFYVKQWVWPVMLSTVYAPPTPFALSNPVVVSGVAVTLVLGGVALALRRRAPALLTGGVVFVVLLAPTFSIVRFSPVIAYDRYVHLPALGLVMMSAFALTAALRAPALRTPALIVAWGVALAELLGTRAALEPWRDPVTIWQRAVAVSPGSAMAWNGLGSTFAERGDEARALTLFEAAVKADPGHSDARQNLGRTLRRLGRTSEAMVHLERAVALAPGSPEAALQLGLARQETGDASGAEREFRRALALSPDYPYALAPLGLARIEQGDRSEGLALLRHAVQVTPDPGAHLVLANLLLEQPGGEAEAVGLLSGVIQRVPDFVPALNTLAWIRATRAAPFGDSTQALALSARAVEQSRGADASVLDTRAAAEASAGRFEQAAVTARLAITQARASGDSALARDIAGRLARYERRQAYRAEPPQH